MLHYWLGTIGLLAIGNALQCYYPKTAQKLLPRMYHQPNLTPLTGRMFGNWTITSGLIRIATCITMKAEPMLFYVCMSTFMVVLVSMTLECFYYKTAMISSPGIFPTFIISAISLVWMYAYL